ncbi:Synaptotagmin-5 [Clonorchis sinensis]|uniref:Synaptotagmin-5 n=2 Tax=Clonorchis sinensis TaxID=79923 RepID=A0A8T1M7B1_CLOSI|nr:Synaptotagmin-5 [Clonorchis sinensis]GAA42705.2 synaptotagmin-2 [Clonorchis sinensis]
MSESTGNRFLEQLVRAFHVESTTIAVVILILICLVCVSVAVVLVLLINHCVKTRATAKKRKAFRKRLASVYLDEISEHEKTRGKYGQLLFSIHYQTKDSKLIVIVMQATFGESSSTGTFPDTYVTVKLASDKYGKLKQYGDPVRTELQRRKESPCWNYRCTFDVEKRDLKHTHVLFELFSYDTVSQDTSIGRLAIPLSKFDLGDYTDKTLEHAEWLQAGESKFNGIGEVYLALSYQKTLEVLECQVFEARNLKVTESMKALKHKLVNMHVELRCNQLSLGSFETRPKSDLVTPYFNERFNFKLNKDQLSDAKLTFQLQSCGKQGKKHILGSFAVGATMDMSGGGKHWAEMLENSPRSQAMWHTLVPKEV